IALLSGVASLQSGDAEQGLLYLEQATSLDPANQLLKLQLARAYLASGRNADASGVLKDTFGGEAQLDAALLQLFAELRLGDAAAGEAQVQQLLAAFPREPRA